MLYNSSSRHSLPITKLDVVGNALIVMFATVIWFFFGFKWTFGLMHSITGGSSLRKKIDKIVCR